MRLLLVLAAMGCGCRAQISGCNYTRSLKAGSTRQGIAAAQSFKGSSGSATKLAYWFMQWLGLHKILGDVVECGVFRGGTSAVMAVSQLAAEGRTPAEPRTHWLYDTFDGMARPTAEDGVGLVAQWDQINSHARPDGKLFGPIVKGKWTFGGGPSEVARRLAATGMPCERLLYVQGKVEDTLSNPAIRHPDQIAMLRLDTDWYNSTRVEFEVLLPRLVPGGVLILDDFFTTFKGKGHTEGFSKPSSCCSGLATTEHFPPSLIQRGIELSRTFRYEAYDLTGKLTREQRAGARPGEQWFLVRSSVENKGLGPMRHEKYWATPDEVRAMGSDFELIF